VDDTHPDAPSSPEGAGTSGAVGAPRVSGLRLLLRLATLAGADQRPGELIGWGPVHADLARTIAAMPSASWWYVLTDPSGMPLAIGQVRSRPDGALRRRPGYGGPEIWLQATPEALTALAEQALPPGWAGALAEISGKAECQTGPPTGDRRKRLPGAQLRRWLAVRDKTCVFPGCRVPASRSDADHSIEHANGGQTVDTNLGPACRHDHRLRHEGGWTLTQTQAGHFTWTSRFGHTYHRQRPPDLNDLPDPMPESDREPDEPDPAESIHPITGQRFGPSTEDWQHDSCMQPPPPPPPEPPPPPPPPTPHDDDPPPF
jgi:hypothetical protein